MRFKILAAAAAGVLLAACSPEAEQSARAPAPAVAMNSAARTQMEQVNAARFTMHMPASFSDTQAAAPTQASQPTAAAADADETTGESSTATAPQDPGFDAGMVRLQVLLDRQHFSPGVIDGHDGENVRKALTAYQRANGLPETGRADDAMLTRLERADGGQALVAYVLTEADVAGPFVDVPESMQAQSRLEHLGYESALEAVAEKFHMDADLLQKLNPSVEFTQPGVEIVVANAGGGLSGSVARVEIDKSALTLRAYDANDRLLAFYPVTIGDGNTPSGELEITAIAFDPTYNYDADELPSFNDASGREFTIRPGPNNPVGLVWIALNRDGYGIHGTPNPELISKTSSHGCIRLTNWDAVELGRALAEGVPVRFLDASQARRVTSRG